MKIVVYNFFFFKFLIKGFRITGDHVIPGNYGLKDQATALRWAKENIINFNGDHNQVTIFGQCGVS